MRLAPGNSIRGRAGASIVNVGDLRAGSRGLGIPGKVVVPGFYIGDREEARMTSDPGAIVGEQGTGQEALGSPAAGRRRGAGDA